MTKRLIFAPTLCIFLTCSTAAAQDLCPVGTASDKLVCLIPGVFGINGLTLDANGHQGHFEQSFVESSMRPLDSAIGTQSGVLPLSSPSSGITFSWNPVAKVFSPSTESYGPILGERAETVGKGRVFLGFSYQYFNFNSLDGLSLKNLPVVLTHQDDSIDGPPPPGTTCSITPSTPTFITSSTGSCGYVRDVVKTSNRIDLKIHQFITFVSYGLTDRIDVSAVIPIENVRMGIFSEGTIVPNSQSGDHIFNCGSSFCLSNGFSNIRDVSGISDITLRVKGAAWKGERAGLSLGLDLRTPSGDELNFLGSGAIGVRPFMVWSYRSRISPHVFVAYETNGSSPLAGDISTGKKVKLPSQLIYSAGADAWITKRFTVALDLIGQQVFEARRVAVGTLQELGACKNSACNPADGFDPPKSDPNLTPLTGSYNITNASVGIKIRPFASLLIAGNALIKLNESGL